MAETSKTVPLTETAEFKAAVAKAVAEMAPQLVASAVAELAKAAPAQLPAGDDVTQRFFSQMALSIAEISDQGSNRKRVAPEILARRAAAAERCAELLANARKQNLKPEYRVLAKVYFGERVIEPFRRNPDKTVVGQDIIWYGEPNDALHPLNEPAKEIFAAFRDSRGSTEQLKAVKGPHGGVAALDNRPVWMTPGGLVVKGDPPPRMFVAATLENDDLAFNKNNDPNATEVHVLGTIAPAARKNFVDLAAVVPQPVA